MSQLSHIPKVDKILQWPEIQPFLRHLPRPVLVNAIRKALQQLRAETIAGRDTLPLSQSALAERIRILLNQSESPNLRSVINGTGIVIHTNLGRSPLPATALREIEAVARGYSNLEFNLSEGTRGSRHSHVASLLCELTGAEAALVVNNNAAALFLCLAALAPGREVVVSRGELVEIGGSFRIPDIMRQSGCFLTEVGTTNRTHPGDYRNAVNEQSALLLKVHRSNFAIVGFTAEVSSAELVSMGRELGLPVVVDAGSGNLLHGTPIDDFGEPSVQGYVREGADLVMFSGDKLLGGPQAGIVVGTARLVEKLKTHPLMRVLRIDKLTLAALEATLRLYRDEREALAQIPTLRMLTATREDLLKRGRNFIRRARREIPAVVELSMSEGSSQPGGGTLPLVEIPTAMIVVKREGLTPQQVEQRLRLHEIPVIGRIAKGNFVLDLRTIPPSEERDLLEALSASLA